MRTLLFAVLAFLTATALYWTCVRFSYIPLDDLDYVVNNPNMRKGLTAETFKWAFNSQRYADNCEWHPAAWLSMLADVSLSCGNRMPDGEWKRFDNRVARTMHLHNVLLHAACTALLFLLMALLCRGRVDEPWLLCLSLLWSLHPLRNEVVCWIAERKEVLSVFWMLVSLLLYFNPSSRRPRLSTAASFLAFVFALLAKPVAVTLPAVLLAWDWAIRGKARILRLVPFALASAGTCVMTIISQQAAIREGSTLSSAARLTALFGAPVIYIRQTLWPARLAAVYEPPMSGDWLSISLGLVLVLTIVALCSYWLYRRAKGLPSLPPLDICVFGVAWAYIGLVPMLGFVKVGGATHSDRYTYWIGCGVVTCLALLLAEYGGRWRASVSAWISRIDGRPFDWEPARRALLGLFAVTLAVLSAVTLRQQENWRTSLSFLRTTIRSSGHYSFAEKLHALVRDTQATGWDEVEFWYRDCLDRFPCIEANIALADFLLTRPPVESTLNGRDRLYSEPKLIAEYVLRQAPENERAKEILTRIDKARRGEK